MGVIGQNMVRGWLVAIIGFMINEAYGSSPLQMCPEQKYILDELTSINTTDYLSTMKLSSDLLKRDYGNYTTYYSCDNDNILRIQRYVGDNIEVLYDNTSPTSNITPDMPDPMYRLSDSLGSVQNDIYFDLWSYSISCPCMNSVFCTNRSLPMYTSCSQANPMVSSKPEPVTNGNTTSCIDEMGRVMSSLPISNSTPSVHTKVSCTTN